MINIVPILISINIHLGLEPNLLPAICSVESDFRNVINHDDGGSPSYGLCQVKLETARSMLPGVTEIMLMESVINAYIAGLYLKHQTKRYGDDLNCIISAYNAGSCIKSNQDTYVKKVLERMEKVKLETK